MTPPSRFQSIWARWAPPGALLGALLLIYWPLLLPGWAFSGGDFLQLFVPLKQWSMESWAAGRAPFWNPYSFLGAPFLASMQPAALYPPDAMLLALRGDLMWAIKAQMFLHLCVMAMGCYWLYRVGAGGERWGAAMAAMAVAGGAFMRFHLEHVNQVAALAWAPWIIGAAWMALARGRRGALLAVPALVALQALAGHPQHLYYTLMVLGGMGAFALAAGPDRRRATGTIGLMAMAVAGGLGLAAPQLLPAMELAGMSSRAGQSVAAALEFSLPPERLLSFIHPRQGLTFENALAFTNLYGEFGCYMGLIPLVLAAAGAGAVAAWGRMGRDVHALMRTESGEDGQDRWRWAWPIGAAVCLVMALGGHGGLYTAAATILPGMSGFRVPARWLFFAAVFLGGTAQFGWALVCGRAAGRRDLKILSRADWVGFLTFVLVAVDLQTMLPPGPMDRQAQRAMIAVTMESAERTSAALAGRSGGNAGARLYRFEYYDADHTMNNSPEGVRERLLRLQPEAQMMTGLPAVFGYEQALLPTRAMTAMKLYYHRNFWRSDPDAELLALLGARWMMSDRDLRVSGPSWRPLPLRGESALGGQPMEFFENLQWRGAAFDARTLAAQVNWVALAPEVQARGQEARMDYKIGDGALFGRGDAAAQIELTAEAGGRYSGVVKRESGDEAEAVQIIWSQTAMKGWRVEYEDGADRIVKPVEILGPFHLTFELPRNIAYFRLTYLPRWWYPGIWVSLTSLIFYLVLGIRHVKEFRHRNECA